MLMTSVIFTQGFRGGSRVVQGELLNQRDCHRLISGETILW